MPVQSRPQLPAHRILIGPAGWSYPDWNGILYPERRPRGFHEAAYLAQFFDTIEINTSFYSPLRPDFAAQWIERVSGNPRFRFTAKMWQRFTHETGATAEDEKSVRADSMCCTERGDSERCCCSIRFGSTTRLKICDA